MLVNSTFLNNSLSYKSSKCLRPRCTHCCNIVENSIVISSETSNQVSLRSNTNCCTRNAIYLITCAKCQMQYIGQPQQQTSRRMNSHIHDINNFTDPLFSTHVASHFNLPDHTIKDFLFVPFDIVDDEFQRLCKESYWIHKFQTMHPKGLNAKVLYNI